jgi:hypothetical protein
MYIICYVCVVCNMCEVMYVSSCLSARLFAWKNSASTERIFMIFDIEHFSKIVEKIQVELKSDNNNRYFT